MISCKLLPAVFLLAVAVAADRHHQRDADDRLNQKMDLWARGAFDLDLSSHDLTLASATAPIKHGPIRQARISAAAASSVVGNNECVEFECASLHSSSALKMRGGGSDSTAYAARLDARLSELGTKYGPAFTAAIEQNKKDHAEDCTTSCEAFYCATDNDTNRGKAWAHQHAQTFKSYSFGGVPPEDFAEEFGFPLDLIKVTQNVPLFSAEEAAEVIAKAEEEGVDKNEYVSGKFKLGGDWLVNLPNTRAWFNKRLETTFFPLLSYLFPEIVSSPAVLRAHSVSLLKYNASHSRTDGKFWPRVEFGCCSLIRFNINIISYNFSVCLLPIISAC